MKFTNNQEGPRAVHVHGAAELGGGRTVWIDPGDTVDLDGVTDDEVDNAKAQGVETDGEDKPRRGRPPKDAE